MRRIELNTHLLLASRPVDRFRTRETRLLTHCVIHRRRLPDAVAFPKSRSTSTVREHSFIFAPRTSAYERHRLLQTPSTLRQAVAQPPYPQCGPAMQRTPLPSSNVHLPYSKWSQHRADNGLIYLSHPHTGDVKWLWSRHHDPSTSKDYLVNTVTGHRHWVTPKNEHLCPIKQKPTSNRLSSTTSTNKPSPTTTATEKPSSTTTSTNRMKTPTRVNPALNPPTHLQKLATSSSQSSAPQIPKGNFRQIEAPKSLGLTADEVLMLVPETGRRYVFNKKTKTSRWLPQPASTFDDSEHVRPNLKKQNRAPIREAPIFDRRASANAANGATGSATAPNFPNNRSLPAQGRRPPENGRFQHPSMNRDYAAPAPPGSAHVQQEQSKDASAAGDIARKLEMLSTVATDVKKITSTGKYDMNYLRRLPTANPSAEQLEDGAQRLLELGEYLTQQMLKVDTVESGGNQSVRAIRKENINIILALTDEADELRKAFTKLQA